MPLVYLVDSSGVFLPMQDEVFPDDDDFGRIFRNNAVLSAQGIPQFAAIMGNCVAGGAYLPVLCDTVLMTEGSGLYLAGPALVKAAIGQEHLARRARRRHVHAAISGTVDYREPDDDACLARLRRLVALLASRPGRPRLRAVDRAADRGPPRSSTSSSAPTRRHSTTCATCWPASSTAAGSTSTAPSTAGRSSAASAGWAESPLGIVANQRLRFRPEGGGPYPVRRRDLRRQRRQGRAVRARVQPEPVPILFIQDVNGFDVGRDAERTGIIRRGAKLVNAVSNSTVPKITLIVGHSFGAGHYALCGKAFDPRFLFAWPGARYAVMGASRPRGRCSTSTSAPSSARARRSTTPSSTGSADELRRVTIARPTSATPPRGSGSTRSSTRRRPARS